MGSVRAADAQAWASRTSCEVDFREVVNAVRYLVRSGCGWRMLPIHFGPWQTVYGWFRELARRFLFQTIHDVALMLDRERAGREASPTAGVIDSQSDRSIYRGFRTARRTNGRGWPNLTL
ncbi:putative transposase [Mesorhizobium amorphae CCNWGS0123]|uniref:Putative transposase n=1 Tax=Mesorhizobium amorphae CCNWGS0123 TaxID=1082933 RepID=G6Y3R2_9HYPH|nr:putative transposase [Mesorhizobium amorphae CCNWGS0123]